LQNKINFLDKLTVFVTNIVAIISIFLVFLIIFDASNRYFFSSGSIAIQELEWHIFDIIILLSLSYTLFTKGHVKVDIIYNNLTQKYQKIIDLIGNVLFILPFSFLMIYVSVDFVILSFEQGETSPNPNGLTYRFLIKSVIILGFSLLILQTISEIFKNIKQILEKQQEKNYENSN
jgi:TRAP-type mannitol/chloroaromatic compound transport system permease small subunit